MNHEPECPIGNSDDPLTFYAARQSVAIVCVCANIRAAYQRGREDEKAVWMNPCWQCGMNADSAYICDGCLEENGADVRWEGEQA